MFTNYITIDPSLNCTAVIINDEKYIYAKDSYGASEKTGKLKKWFELCEPYITYKWIKYDKSNVHSCQELMKLNTYDEITTIIVDDIKSKIIPGDIIVGIEGFSYSSQAGPLIDLVTFSTLLRIKLYKQLTQKIKILQPSELKLEACKLTYKPIEVGVKVKKFEYKNSNGVSGGKFKKPEIYKALIENNNLNCDWVNYLRTIKDEIFELNMIPKPIEDINDAKIFYEILKKNKYF